MKIGEMMDMYQPGDVVYVIIRNPHVQGAANVQEAAVVRNPDDPGELALFVYETYYPLNDEVAVYPSQMEAEQEFQQAFGTTDSGEWNYYG
ncbi:transcriptional regulator [Aquibacillus koreensis]|uniref:Transcriptional regulator n=1 Tax=Aquibacillus koreensis TaxID=279446 RepID=A0A9X4AJK8_9BACI|nr:transcriptional regulator SplA domain-containing protein [Aquibacillus koreensis]MCT2536202.1 transcriptional regulator [Aquibacillus koreensis]MDC3422126.1 transcriptional regulator [Aquibacillus koreensis]